MFISLLLTFNIISSVSSQKYLESQYPLYGLSEIAAKSSGNSECVNQLKTLYNGIKQREIWALRVLDSSGSPVNGFILGNNYWLGTYSQCRWMSSKEPMTISEFLQRPEHFPPFEVEFFVSLFKQNNSHQSSLYENIIHLGLCLPLTCSLQELQSFFNIWSTQNFLTVQNLFNFTMEFQKIRRVHPDTSWMYNPLTIVLYAITFIAAMLTFSGTIYDIYVWSPRKKRMATEIQLTNNSKPLELMKIRNIQESSDLLIQDNNLNDCFELKIDNSQHKSIPAQIRKPMEAEETEEKKLNSILKLSLCFSATNNMKKIFKNPKTKNDLSVVHGLQFLGMIWLIWLYSVFYLKHYSDNKPLAQKLSEGFSERIISNSTFSLDTFFFTSGFMLAFKYYKKSGSLSKVDRIFSVKKKVNEFSLMALKRFIRLTPVYMVVLAVVIISVKSIRQTSLFEIEEHADEICQTYWWRNLAYINNLFKGNEMCMSWSWYLSTDMQFFLLGIFILIISKRFWKFSLSLSITLIVSSSVITGYLNYGNRYIPAKLQPQLALLNVLHYSPWTRVGPYILGLFTGHFIVHLKTELFIKRTTLIICWVMWILCNIWALFGLYNKNMSVVSTALHAGLSRTAWGFGLSWIVIACNTGNAGAIKAILSYPGWIPFSKLSYSAYLISPLIINLIISNAETAMHLDFIQMIVYFFGHLGITYFCAFFFSILLEIPLATLGKKVTGKTQAQNQLNQT